MSFAQGWTKKRAAAMARKAREEAKGPIRQALSELYAAQAAGFKTADEHKAFLAAQELAYLAALSPSVTQDANGDETPLPRVEESPVSDTVDLTPEVILAMAPTPKVEPKPDAKAETPKPARGRPRKAS